jgi:hypothetical protein
VAIATIFAERDEAGFYGESGEDFLRLILARSKGVLPRFMEARALPCRRCASSPSLDNVVTALCGSVTCGKYDDSDNAEQFPDRVIISFNGPGL